MEMVCSDQGYIVKYTKEGKYYALSKRSGRLYEFYQFTFTDSYGGTREEFWLKRVPYSVLEKYKISINKDNWKDFIDYNHKNIHWDAGDTLDLIRDILRIGSIGTLLIGGTLTRILLAFGVTFNFGFVGIPAAIMGTVSLFIGRTNLSSIDNARRARKSYNK